MKIAIFSDVFYPELSGLSDSIISLSEELAKRGHKIRFYVPRYSQKNYIAVGLLAKELNLHSNINIKRLSSISYKTGTGQGRFVVPSPFTFFDIKKFDPDVIHTQLFFGAGLEALWSARKLKKPLIGTNHTAIKEFMKYAPFKGKWATDMMLRYVNWYYGSCDILTAPSRSVGEEMKSYGFKKELIVVSNPIDTEIFSPAKNKSRAFPRGLIPSDKTAELYGKARDKNQLKKKFGFGDKVIIHAGRIADERKINVIIEALSIVKKEIPEAELAIAGTGIAKGELESLADNLGIKSSVKFMGFLERSVLAEAYNAADIFAIASTADTQSLVMMQAMASGLPVVGVNARALPEYINDENGFVVEPDNPKALAEKIIFLFKNPEIMKKLGVGARKFSINFSRKNIADCWEKIYEKTIKKYNLKNNNYQ